MMFCYCMDEVYVVVKRMLICCKHRYCHAREISDPSDNKVLYYISKGKTPYQCTF